MVENSVFETKKITLDSYSIERRKWPIADHSNKNKISFASGQREAAVGIYM